MFHASSAPLRTSLSLIALSIMSVNAILISTAANAETAVLDTLIITGEKIDKSLKETTTAVSVFTKEQLTKSEVLQVRELAIKAPNVVAGSFSNVSIRGMSGGGAATGGAALITGARPRVATVIDGTTQDWSGYNFTPSSLWDTKQIEILRGPQSTTQGTSAIAGALVINTNDPTFEREAAVRVGLESYKNGNVKHNLAAMLSGPFLENELAYRVAIDTSKGEGWLNYEKGSLNVPNLSDSENINLRTKLLWEPENIPELSAKLTYNFHANNGEHANFASNTDKGMNTQTLDITSGTYARVQDSNEYSAALDLDYEISAGITNYFHLSHLDSDIYANGYTQGAVASYDIEQTTSAVENRLVFDNEDSQLSGVVGVFFSKKQSVIDAFQGLAIDTDYTTYTRAIYGEGSYALTPETTATLGLRIENEDTLKTGSVFTATAANQKTDKTYTLPKLEIMHALSEATTLGASVRKGYSPSGTGVSFSAPDNIYTFDSEKVTSFELSSKSLFGESTTLNANVFYNDYSDYQALSGLGIVNVEDSYTYGLELEASAWATPTLELYGSVGLLKSKIGGDHTNQGNQLSSAPKSNISFGFNKKIGSKWSVGADATYVGEYYSDLANTNTVGGHTITNTRVEYKTGDISVNGYIKNLTNENAVYYRDSALASVGQTRTLGISFNYRM